MIIIYDPWDDTSMVRAIQKLPRHHFQKIEIFELRKTNEGMKVWSALRRLLHGKDELHVETAPPSGEAYHA